MLISFPLPLRVLAALTTAFVCALASTPSVVSLAERVHAVDLPGEERKIHKRAVPRLGGIGILAAFFAALLCFTRPDAPFSGVLRGALLIALMGAADDCFTQRRRSCAPAFWRPGRRQFAQAPWLSDCCEALWRVVPSRSSDHILVYDLLYSIRTASK